MAYFVIHHTVEDYDQWKPLFDEHGETRKIAGSTGCHLFRNAERPHELFLFFEWDTPERARQFLQSEELQQTMHRAGVAGPPEIYFLDKIEKFPA